ncbi:cytochrome c oxidase assembly factor 7 homolog isoform X2 [Halyomorpha halys]|uniref:cytochrome c oxidase assembly factor 7 homolog isoform X2 n=1 Tax=Halyomorpha halys TaxID=286706 RepID=UPI0034D20E4F
MTYNLKNEEEVKEYIKNLGTEYRFGCFSEKKPEVCHLLGDYLEAINQDFDKAGKIYKVNCDNSNFGRSCFKIGNYFLAGKGGLQKSDSKAIEYYEKGCELNDFDSCFRGGVISFLSSKSKSPIRTLKQSVDLLTKGCEGKNKDACFHLSSLHLVGATSGTEEICEDMAKAFHYAVKACELGNIPACANVSTMYRKGEGVEQNSGESEKYKKLAIEMQKEMEYEEGLIFQQAV